MVPVAAFSQKKSKTTAVIVAGRVLTTADSLRVQELFFEGIKAKINQNSDRAGELFAEAVAIDGRNDAALFELANLYHSKEKESEAETFARKAVTVEPENEWYWLLLADIYKRGDKWEDLQLVFNELIKISPGKADYYFDRANVLQLQNKYKEALSLYDNIEKEFGTGNDLVEARRRINLKQGKFDKVIVELEESVKYNSAQVKDYLLLSDLYHRQKNDKKALQILEQAKTKDPDNVEIRASLANIYTAAGKNIDAFVEQKEVFGNPDMDIDTKVKTLLSYFPQFEKPEIRAKAEELSSLLVKAHPQEAKAFAIYGDVLFQQRKLQEAKASYKKALELNSQVYLIWEQLINIELSLNQPVEAAKDGEEALTVFPNQGNLYFLTALAYIQTQKHEQSISYLKDALSLSGKDNALQGQIYSSLGDAYNAVKKHSESDQAYEKALEISPDNIYALNNYAYYLSLRGEKIERAEKMSKRSNELDPGNASFQDTYAWILFKQKKYAEARLWMEKAISKDKNNPTQVEHYGDILFGLGEVDKAVLQWQKAKQAGPGSKILEKKINERKYFE